MCKVDWRWLHEVESQSQKVSRLSCQLFRGNSAQHSQTSEHPRRLQGVRRVNERAGREVGGAYLSLGAGSASRSASALWEVFGDLVGRRK